MKRNCGKDILEYNNLTFYIAYKTKFVSDVYKVNLLERYISTSGKNMTIVRDDSSHLNHDEVNLHVYKFN